MHDKNSRQATIKLHPSSGSSRGRVKWAATWQNQQSGCATSEDSDQSGHPSSLNRVFAVHMKKPWVLSYPFSAQRRLWLDWAIAQADLSLRWAHNHVVGFVMSWLKYEKPNFPNAKVDKQQMSHDMTKPTNRVCAQRGLRSACASAQSDQSICCAFNR